MANTLLNTEKTYGSITKTFYWGIAFLLLILFAVAFFGHIFSGNPKNITIIFHSILCVILFFISSAQILWWSFDKAVLRLDTTPIWMAKISKLINLLLRIIVIVIPVSGWAMVSAYQGNIDIYGVFSIPSLTGQNADLGRALHGLYILGYWILAVLLFFHIGIAFYQHHVLKNSTIRRILPAVFFNINSIGLFHKKKEKQKIVSFPKKFKK